MGKADIWALNTIGPAILLIVLIWLVIRVPTKRETDRDGRSEDGSTERFKNDSERRAQGTDEL